MRNISAIKESNPVRVAEFVVSQEIDKKAAFAWCIFYPLRKRYMIIAAVNAKYHNRIHKFGIDMPKSVADCKGIYTASNNILWQDTIAQKITAARVAFKIKYGEDKV